MGSNPTLSAIFYDLAVLDGEVAVSYTHLDVYKRQLLSQVISGGYEQRSVIITTNLELSKWVNIFYDEQMTATMIDRLVHHSYLLLFDGQSYRIKNSLISKCSRVA